MSGNYVYVGKGTSVIVLENAGGRLTQVGQQLNLPSYLSVLKVQGKTLYAAAGSAGLYIVDISNLPADSQLMRVVVNNGQLFCSDRANGILCFDISKPAEITLKGFYSHSIPIPLTKPRNVVGINRLGYGNLVGDNNGLGISAMGATFGNLIEGNYVGTDITGTKAVGNNYSHGIICELGSYGNIIRNNVTRAYSRGGINL